MSIADFKKELEFDTAGIRRTLADLAVTFQEAGNNPLSATQRTAAAAYISQCYTGVENILKRIIRHRGASMPVGVNWHIELVKMFRDGMGNAPVLIDGALFTDLTDLRRFRHAVLHRYGFTLDGETIADVGKGAPVLLERFLDSVQHYLIDEEAMEDHA